MIHQDSQDAAIPRAQRRWLFETRPARGVKRWLAGICCALAMLGLPASAATLCDTQVLREALPPDLPGKGVWRNLYDRDDICIWSRSRYSDQVKEVAAAALIEAAPRDLAGLIKDCDQVLNVFRDVADCRHLSAPSDEVRIFQQLSVPWPAQDRFFTVDLKQKRGEGGAFEVTWALSDQRNMVQTGRGVALARNTGRWRFRPAQQAATGALALYYLSIDPGGSVALPNWLVDFGHQKAVPNMIRDIRSAYR